MGIKLITDNRKAFHEYTISEKLEAGICLTGTEVKSARLGKVNLTDGWIDIEQDEAYLVEAHIARYSHGNVMNHEERRRRKLLLHRGEIEKLSEKIAAKGYTVVPLRMYFKKSYIKLEIGLGKGKKQHDKREATKEREANRAIERAVRAHNKRDV